MSKDINEKKYDEYKKKKLNKYLYIFLSLIIVVLEILALFNVINMIWGLVLFVILYLLKKILIK